jgi:diadenosine tetraphosphatase ApaH/serine/threonine PP2A family protein phosphatase
MRYAILSDIHGNYEALQAVVDDIDTLCLEDGVKCDALWCLGDVVGYGPDPNACVRTIRDMCDLSVAGNHDFGASGEVDLNEFSDMARESLIWTREQLLPQEIDFLKTRPDRTTVPMPEDITLVHGSPVVPLWEYLLTPEAAALSFISFPTRFCLVGHTHLPTIYLQESARFNQPRVPVLAAHSRHVMEYGSDEGYDEPTTAQMQVITTMPPCFTISSMPYDWWLPEEQMRAIINPGSVGQPRDGDPRAAYVIYDTDRGFLFRRVRYWIERTMEKMHDEGMSEALIERLGQGY